MTPATLALVKVFDDYMHSRRIFDTNIIPTLPTAVAAGCLIYVNAGDAISAYNIALRESNKVKHPYWVEWHGIALELEGALGYKVGVVV